MPALPDFDSARARLRRLKSGLPRQKIARKNGGRAPKSPFLARGGSSATGGSLPAGRATRGFSLLFLLAMLLLCARWYFGQKLDLSGQVERVLRAQIAPQLEKQLGARVEFGGVETDWLGRVVVREIVIGRNAALPTGALARAKSVTLQLDLPGLVLRRATFPGAIRSATLDAPQIYLRRDKTGLNWAKLLQSSSGDGATKWQGRISATNGRVYFFDSTIPSASRQPLIVDARGLDGTLDAFLDAPYRFTAMAKTPYLGAKALLLPAIGARGAIRSDGENGLFTLETSRAPFAPLADFAFPKREIVALGGNVGGRIVFTLKGGDLAQHGALSLQNLAFSAPALRDPKSGRAVPISALSGPFEFAGNAFSTPGVKFEALGGRFQAAGAISLDGSSPFDFDVETAAFPVASARRFLPAPTQKVGFSSAAAPLKVHLSGNAAGKSRQVTANGILDAPRATVSDLSNARRSAATFSTLRLNFAASATLLAPRNDISNWKFAARGAATGAQIAAPSGKMAARNTIFSVRAAQTGGVEITGDARDFALDSARYGQSRGAILVLAASAPDAMRPDLSGTLRVQGAQTQKVRLAAISPDLARAIQSSGALDVQARFSGLDAALDPQKLRGAATFALASLQLNQTVFGPQNTGRALGLQPGDFSLRALRGRVVFGGKNLEISRAAAISSLGTLRLDANVPVDNPSAARIALSLPAIQVSAARLAPLLRAQDLALEGDWQGRVSLLSRTANAQNRATRNAPPSFGLDFDLQTTNSTLRGVTNTPKAAGALILSAPRLRGRAELTTGALPNNAPVWNAVATLESREARVQSGVLGQVGTLPAPLSGARAAGVRFSFAARSNSKLNSYPRRARRETAILEEKLAEIAPLELASIPLEPSIYDSVQIAPQKPRDARTQNTRFEAEQNVPIEILGRFEARSVSAPLPRGVGNGANSSIALREVRADLETTRGGLEVPRFAARYGAANLVGTARLEGGAARLKMLARGLDLASAQRVFAPQSRRNARVTGFADALIEVSPRQNPRAAIRVPRGQVSVPWQGQTVPIALDGARAEVSLLGSGAISVRNAVVWSEGARIWGDSMLENARWKGNIGVSGARLARLGALPVAQQLASATRPDGLFSGQFTFDFDPRDFVKARLEGRADLRLAQLFGAQIDAARARISLQNGARGVQISVDDLSGEVEDAPFKGGFNADFARNTWSAKISASDLKSERLTRLRALKNVGANTIKTANSTNATNTKNTTNAQPRAAILARALPLAGDLGAQIELTGTLQNAGGDFAPRAQNGFARLSSGPLAWRGRPVGVLRADIEIVEGVARAKVLEIARIEGARNGIAGQDETPPIIQISGQLPLDASSPDLDAKIQVAAAPLSFFTQALQEGREALRDSGANIPFFERAVAYVDALPEGTTGRVALDASLSGAWSAPRVRVSNLTLREARTRVPTGGFSPPATLDAAFTFEGGAVTVEKAEFKIKKSMLAAADSSADAGEDDDTLLRVEPGGSAVPDGPISLAADIFNANLSQLSPWVPALRTNDGAPLLRGELSEFSFRVGGTTIDPSITGSVQGENLSLENYTLDRLRVSRFEIGGGSARIEPGNLTVVKGAFQSSAAYGRVPWSWSRPGPVMDGPLDVHFPLQTRDFGALVGTFVPALTVADADEFSGSIDVTGSLQAPALSGAITIRGGQFRLDSQKNPFAAGLREVSGTVRFVGGTQILIDADDPLKGKLVSASAVVGRAARRVETAAREPGREIVAAGGPDPNSGANAANSGRDNSIGGSNSNTSAARQIAASATKAKALAAAQNEPKLAGSFVLRGGVERPAQIDALLDSPLDSLQDPALSREERRSNTARLRALLDPAAALSRLKYDLNLALDGGSYASNTFGGVSDVSAGLIWKSGANDAQNVRWMVAARGQRIGQGARKLKNGGTLSSFGEIALRRDFGSGIEAMARSGARDFSGEADFAAFPVAKRLDISKFPDRRAQIRFSEFASSLTGVGSGTLDGRLVLDNGAAQQRAPRDAVRLQNASQKSQNLATQNLAIQDLASRRRGTLFGPGFESELGRWDRAVEAQNSGAATEIQGGDENAPNTESAAPDSAAPDGAPLRLGGVLTLANAEIYGAPAGGEGAALLLSRLPTAPRFDVRLKIGRDVQIVTSSFRAGLEGEMVASGSPSNPQILGVLTTRDGQVRFPNARARVETGRVTISLTRDPDTDGLRTRVEIDATARGQAGRYAITLRMRGPLDLSGAQSAQSLQIEVSSNPPLSQSEAFEQLLGTVPNVDEEGRTGSANRAYASAVLNVLSAPLFSGVEQTLAQTLGLTSVGFEYRFNEPLAVQFTKALGDRVFVSYRRSLGSGPTGSLATSGSNGRTPFELRIEYRLRGDYLLGLQTDERQIPSLTIQKTRRF